MVGPGRRTVPAPAPTPLPYGLLSAAVVVDDDTPAIQAGVEYETLLCGRAELTAEACFTGTTPGPLAPNAGVGYTEGDAFTVYVLHTCGMVGGGLAGAPAAVAAKFASGEGRAIEAGFAAAYLTRAATTADPFPDLTPTAGTALPLIDAVATVEEWAGDRYSGVPTFHAARSTGTMMTNKAGVGVSAANGRLETGQGSIVASGAGYLAASRAAIGARTPAAGQRWLFVTGAVQVRRGPIGVTDPLRMTPGNDVAVLGQRPVVTTAECFRARILVQSPAPAAGL